MPSEDTILNPNVYLNYLDPDVADEYEGWRDFFLFVCGALIWDILSSIPSDLIIIRSTKPTPVLFAYFSSRLCALAVTLISILALTGPVRNCGVLELVLCVFIVLATGSSSYLFLKRIHAVFFQERLVCHAFTAFWVAAVGASTVVFPGYLHHYYEIANTRHCMNLKVKDYVAVASAIPLWFDSLVYFAITFKIIRTHPRAEEKPRGWKCFRNIRNIALPRLSRAVLEGGQQYYSITNGFNTWRFVSALSSATPLSQLSPSVPVIAVTSVMACRVFRNLKLEALPKTEVGDLTTIQFGDRERVKVQHVRLQKNTESSVQEVDLGLGQC